MWIPDAPYYFQGKKLYSSSVLYWAVIKIGKYVPESLLVSMRMRRLKSPYDIRTDNLGVWVFVAAL
jgi:hypothetical protein